MSKTDVIPQYEPQSRKSPSLWIRFKIHCTQMVHNESLRHLQVAVQSTTAFIAAGLIGFKSDVSTELSPAWILLVFAPMLMGDTLGLTVMSTQTMITGWIPPAIVIYVCQVLGMGYHDYASCTIVFMIIAFYMGYTTVAVQSRKMAVILPALLIVTIVQTPDNLLPGTFLWDLIAETFLSCAINVAIAMFLFPRYAGIEVHDRFNFAMKRNEEILDLLVHAVLSNHKAQSDVFLCEVDELLRAMQESNEAMKMKAFFSAYEPMFILRRIFRSKQDVYNSFAPMQLLQLTLSLQWHITSLLHAVRNVNFNETHTLTWKHSGEAILDLVTQYHSVVHLLTNTTDGYRQDRAEIDAAIVSLKLSCDHMFATLSMSLTVDNKTLLAANNPPCVETNAAAALTLSTDSSDSHDEGPITRYDTDAKVGANRISLSFFLFHLSELVQTIDNKFTTPVPVTPPTAAPSFLSRITFSNVMTLLASPFIWFYTTSYATLVVDWRNKLHAGTYTMLLMGVGLIFVTVPKLIIKFDNGQWIVIAMMMCHGDNLGGTMYQSRNRFLGTMFGCIYAYFVSIAVDVTSLYPTMAMFVPLIMFCSVIRMNRQWGYFGTISVANALLITYGWNANLYPQETSYLLLRIQENAVGILLAFVLCNLTFPVMAVTLLKRNIVDVLNKLSASSEKILTAFTSSVSDIAVAGTPGSSVDGDSDPLQTTYEINPDELSVVAVNKQKHQSIAFIAAETGAIGGRVGQQPLLLEQASMELVFWAKPIAELTYHKLILCEKRVLEMMLSIDRALLRISKMTELKAAESSILFGQRVSGEVTVLLSEMARNVAHWSRQLAFTMDGIEDPSVGEAVVDADVSDLESGGVQMTKNGTVTDTRSRSASSVHLETRHRHSKNLERMHTSAVKLGNDCLQFNNDMFRGWVESIAKHNGTHKGAHDVTADTATREASIHHLMDIIAAFNALFYAASHLSAATVDLGNVLYTIITLEKQANHKAF